MLFGGVTNLMRTDSSVEIIKHLNYPIYLLTILGVAKILGAVAILQNKFRTLKEWTYAGFAIDILGASASSYFSNDPPLPIIMPLFFLVVMFISYYLWKKKL